MSVNEVETQFITLSNRTLYPVLSSNFVAPGFVSITTPSLTTGVSPSPGGTLVKDSGWRSRDPVLSASGKIKEECVCVLFVWGLEVDEG